MANAIGELDRIEVTLERGERIILPSDIEKHGFVNSSAMFFNPISRIDLKTGIPPFHGLEEQVVTRNPQWIGQPIGLILAQSRQRALELAHTAVIRMKSVKRPVVCLKEAIEKELFHQPLVKQIETGDIEMLQKDKSLIVIESEVHTNAQFHGYTEPLSAVCDYKNGKFDLAVTTQFPSCLHETVAFALQVPQNQISVSVKRIGGGFGGKGTKSTLPAVAVAMAARIVKQRVCLEIPLRDSLQMVGIRPENLYRYKSYFDKSGQCQGLDFTQYGDSGITDNDGKFFSGPVIIAMSGIVQGPWNIKNVRYSSACVKTNKPPSTFMRAPGILCSAYFMEHVFNTAARELKLDPLHIRTINLIDNGFVDMWGRTEVGDRVRFNFEQVKREVNLPNQLAMIKHFNQNNIYKKQGWSMTPFKYRWTNDIVIGGIKILIGRFDGSVWVANFGVEMGQGQHTRIAQVIADEFGLAFDQVFIMPTTTDQLANCSEDGGSFATLTSLRIAVKCCDILKKRLEPFSKDEHGVSKSWINTVRAAVEGGTVLQETFIERNLLNEDKTNSFHMYGASYAKVEVDLLSGETKLAHLHQTFDLGDPINLAIELGQIEGGCIMGLGHYQRENLNWNNEGKSDILGGAYMAPYVNDLPEKWHISLNKDRTGMNLEPRNPIRSKWAGECGQIFAQAAVFATQNAIDQCKNSKILCLPLTPESVKSAIGEIPGLSFSNII